MHIIVKDMKWLAGITFVMLIKSIGSVMSQYAYMHAVHLSQCWIIWAAWYASQTNCQYLFLKFLKVYNTGWSYASKMTVLYNQFAFLWWCHRYPWPDWNCKILSPCFPLGKKQSPRIQGQPLIGWNFHAKLRNNLNFWSDIQSCYHFALDLMH